MLYRFPALAGEILLQAAVFNHFKSHFSVPTRAPLVRLPRPLGLFFDFSTLASILQGERYAATNKTQPQQDFFKIKKNLQQQHCYLISVKEPMAVAVAVMPAVLAAGMMGGRECRTHALGP